jgi:hypothetical protein
MTNIGKDKLLQIHVILHATLPRASESRIQSMLRRGLVSAGEPIAAAALTSSAPFVFKLELKDLISNCQEPQYKDFRNHSPNDK